LFSYQWQPGFKDPKFRTSRTLVADALLTISKAILT